MHYTKNLARGIIVDEIDAHLLHKYLFHISSDGYVARADGYTRTYLHKMIVQVDSQVDHKNLNKLDNRRDNLRPATVSNNNANRAKPKDNTSGYKGVMKSGSSWKAVIRVNGKYIHIGTYITKEEAALNYDIAAKKYHKEFANLNFNLELT